MRPATAQALFLLSTGQAMLGDLYDIALTTGQVYHFTSFDVPLTASIYSPAAGPFTYKTGLTIKRGAKSQKAGTDGGQMKLTLSPQWNSPNAPVLINGYPLLQAVQLGILDNAVIQLSKLVMPPTGQKLLYSGGSWGLVAGPYPGFIDTSAQAIGDFKGVGQDVQADRLKADITISNFLALMGNQQMPRVLFGVGCWHQVYDAGCGLRRADFTVAGHVTAVGSDAAHFHTNLAQADGYFSLGVITFTSGVNAGFSSNVASFLNAAGALGLNYPFPAQPAVNDNFTIYPGCDLQQSTCSGKFNNLAHFGGFPYTPPPQTIIDGNAGDMPPAQTAGAQAGDLIGSQPSARIPYGPYKT